MKHLPDINLSSLVAGKTPLYVELQAALRRYIEESEITMLPTERTLAEAYGVSRITVRKALQALKDEGVVIARRGHGSVIPRQIADLRSSEGL